MEQEIDVESPKKALTRLLEQMLNHLQKKDTHGFFTNPVNDQIAPGKNHIQNSRKMPSAGGQGGLRNLGFQLPNHIPTRRGRLCPPLAQIAWLTFTGIQ